MGQGDAYQAVEQIVKGLNTRIRGLGGLVRRLLNQYVPELLEAHWRCVLMGLQQARVRPPGNDQSAICARSSVALVDWGGITEQAFHART